MWALYGEIDKLGYYGDKRRYLVARFTSERKALKYIDKSRLKQKRYGVTFKAASLLHGYEGAFVEEDFGCIIDPAPPAR